MEMGDTGYHNLGRQMSDRSVDLCSFCAREACGLSDSESLCSIAIGCFLWPLRPPLAAVPRCLHSSLMLAVACRRCSRSVIVLAAHLPQPLCGERKGALLGSRASQTTSQERFKPVAKRLPQRGSSVGRDRCRQSADKQRCTPRANRLRAHFSASCATGRAIRQIKWTLCDRRWTAHTRTMIRWSCETTARVRTEPAAAAPLSCASRQLRQRRGRTAQEREAEAEEREGEERAAHSYRACSDCDADSRTPP